VPASTPPASARIPDDAELVMGGTLALLAKQGRRLRS
jgi:hypothetical protein